MKINLVSSFHFDENVPSLVSVYWVKHNIKLAKYWFRIPALNEFIINIWVLSLSTLFFTIKRIQEHELFYGMFGVKSGFAWLGFLANLFWVKICLGETLERLCALKRVITTAWSWCCVALFGFHSKKFNFNFKISLTIIFQII